MIQTRITIHHPGTIINAAGLEAHIRKLTGVPTFDLMDDQATSSLILPANRDRMAVVAQLRELGLTVDVRRESPRIQAAIARGKRRRAEQQQWLCEAVDMSERDFNDNGRLEHAIVRAATMADALEQFIAYLIEEERLPDILTREAILDQFEVTAELATVINRYPTSGGTE